MPFTNLPIAAPTARALSDGECKSVLQRARFGHLAFTRQTHVDAVPVHFRLVDGWLYFRANAALRHVIGHNTWVLISVIDMLGAAHFASVVARGTCEATTGTGSTDGDAAALRGILSLRDRPAIVKRARLEADRVARASTVFRVHVDELRGSTTFVPRSLSMVDQLRGRASDITARNGADNANFSGETGEQP